MPWFRSLAVLLLVASAASADDWPQWLGPRRDGSTVEKVTPWKELKNTWRAAIGEGHSSPVVADGFVFIHYRASGKKEAEVVQCFDAATGKDMWRTEYPRSPFKGLFGSGPRATPAVVGGKVYAFGANGIVSCLDAKTGGKLWQVDTAKEFKAPALKFGVSASPLVVGNKVIVAVGAKGASIVAFDKDDGKVVWKSLDDKASYASPILWGSDKNLTAVFLTQKGLVGLKVADGTPQWEFPYADKLMESSTTPIHVGHNILVSSITLGTAMLSLEKKGTKTTPTQSWMSKDMTCYFSTPVCLGTDYVYLVTGTIQGGQSALHCLDAKQGKVLWTKGGVGQYHASLLRTGNAKLLMLEEAGNLVLLDPDPKEYRELARTKICGKTWAHPALASGRLFVRDDKELVCVTFGK